MTKIQGAIIKEQGITFAIAIVKMYVLDSSAERERLNIALSGLFTGMPIILMAQDSHGVPKYWGRTDIVNFLANIHISQIPWKEYTFS